MPPACQALGVAPASSWHVGPLVVTPSHGLHVQKLLLTNSWKTLGRKAEVLALCTTSLLWAGVPQALSPPLTLTVGLVALLHIVGVFAYFVLKSKYVGAILSTDSLQQLSKISWSSLRAHNFTINEFTKDQSANRGLSPSTQWKHP